MSAQRYVAYGLRWDSEIPLPDFHLADCDRSGLHSSADASAADVEVRLGEVPERLEDGVECGLLCRVRPDEHVFDMPGVARYHTQGGRRITVQPAPGAADDAVCAMLSAVPIAALLHQRGALVLHASAVEIDGGVAAIAGRSAVGKSATAAVLMQRGCRIVTDDLCVVTVDAGGALVQPGPRVLHLWRDVCRHLTLAETSLRRVRAELAKYALELDDRRIEAAAPLQAIYVLQTSKLEPGKLTTPGRLKITEILSEQTMGLDSVRAMGKATSHLMTVAQLARRIPVRVLTRPALEIGFQEVADRLLDDRRAAERAVA